MIEISLAEHPELFRGAARVFQSGHGVTASRMTAALQQFYAYSEAAVIRANTQSGVRIVFETDAPRMLLRLRYGAACRPFYAVDIEVADCCTTTFSPNEPTHPYEFSCALPGCGMRQVTIHLPHLAACEIECFGISDHAVWHAVPENPHKILFAGDSITQGMTTTSPTKTFAARTAAALGCDFHNIGVGGGVMEPDPLRLALLMLHFDKMVAAFGVNDCAQKREDKLFREKTASVFRMLENSGVPSYVITPVPWVGAPETLERSCGLDAYRSAINEIAVKFPGVKVIDGYELLPANPEYFFDGIHPNDSGAKLFAEKLAPQLV